MRRISAFHRMDKSIPNIRVWTPGTLAVISICHERRNLVYVNTVSWCSEKDRWAIQGITLIKNGEVAMIVDIWAKPEVGTSIQWSDPREYAYVVLFDNKLVLMNGTNLKEFID